MSERELPALLLRFFHRVGSEPVVGDELEWWGRVGW